MNARIENLQLAATPVIDPMTKPWLQKLYALNNPSASREVSDDVLQELLAQCRQDLSGIFSHEDLIVLLNSAFKRHYDPIEFERLASGICHDSGIELDDYRNTRIGPLVDQLLSLRVASRTIIWPLMEQMRVLFVPVLHGLHRRLALEC